jgi:hypothetical protein
MNVSHQLRMVVWYPPRTGGRVLWQAVRGLGFGAAMLSHVPGAPKGCEDYCVVSTCRHPLSRMVSAWTWTRGWPPIAHEPAASAQAAAAEGFDAYLNLLIAKPAARLISQSEFFAQGGRTPDHLIRYEHQARDTIAMGLPSPAPLRPSCPETAAWGRYYDVPRRITMVQAIWPSDFSALGY